MIIQPALEFDVDAIKATVRLTDILGPLDQSVKFRKVSRPGDEWHGPCPKCGGRDRFAARKADQIWMCRRCHPNWTDVIGLVMWLHGIDFQQAAGSLQAGHVATLTPGELSARKDAIQREQAESRERERLLRQEARHKLRQAVAEQELQARLAQHQEVIRTLIAGGMSREAVDEFGFGYGDWMGHDALTIPWQRRGRLMSMQYRLLAVDSSDKYRWHKGTSYHLWNADTVDQPHDHELWICEGAKKSAAVWSHGVTSTCAVPNNTSAPGALVAERKALAAFDVVYLILDPDSTAQAFDAAREADCGIRVVELPDKVDDWLVRTGGDVDLLMRYCMKARTA